jgi:hypothetical protein
VGGRERAASFLVEEKEEGQEDRLEKSDDARSLPAHEQVVKVEGVVVGESFLVSPVGRLVLNASAMTTSGARASEPNLHTPDSLVDDHHGLDLVLIPILDSFGAVLFGRLHPALATRDVLEPRVWLHLFAQLFGDRKRRKETLDDGEATVEHASVCLGAPIGCREKGERVASRRDPR